MKRRQQLANKSRTRRSSTESAQINPIYEYHGNNLQPGTELQPMGLRNLRRKAIALTPSQERKLHADLDFLNNFEQKSPKSSRSSSGSKKQEEPRPHIRPGYPYAYKNLNDYNKMTDEEKMDIRHPTDGLDPGFGPLANLMHGFKKNPLGDKFLPKVLVEKN